jgi:adenylylsulfate kinase
MIYWFTGQPGAGKTTLATLLAKRISHFQPIIIDGDDLRDIFQNKDYSEEGRRKNVKLAQDISHFLHKKGSVVLVSLVSPYRDQREEFKNLIGLDSIKEIYVRTSIKRGREEFHLPDYEPPLENYIDLNTTGKSDFHSTWELVQKLGL